jgi:hypothetical protein
MHTGIRISLGGIVTFKMHVKLDCLPIDGYYITGVHDTVENTIIFINIGI